MNLLSGDSSSPYVSSSFVVPTEVLQEIGHGHAKEETQAEGEKWTTKSGQSAVNKCHSTSYTPPRCIPKTEEARVQVWTESSSMQTCSAECKEETAMPGKGKACGSSECASGSKRLRLCPEDVLETANPSGHLTGVDDGNATEKALLEDVKPTRAQLDKGEHCRIYLGWFWKGSPVGL